MYKYLATAITGLALLAACSSEPTIETGEDAEVVMGNLHKVDNSKADMAYIDPDVDYSKYRRIMVKPLGVDNVEIIQPDRSSSIANKSDWELTDADKKKLQEMFHSAMVKYLDQKGSFEVVTEPADDVLMIAAALTAIAPTASKDDNRSRATGRSKVYTEGGGALAVVVAYADSQTEEVLAMFKDSRASTSYWGANNSVTNMADVNRMFSSWAIQINDGLEKITSK